jgi:hypothetical protein
MLRRKRCHKNSFEYFDRTGAEAFDGRLRGNTTGLGAMAVSEPPWHARCSDASANGKGRVWRGRSNTHVLHSMLLSTLPIRPDYTG